MTEQAETAINMIVLAAGDNVGVATRDIAAGEIARDIKGHAVTAQEAIPQGHKIALADIPVEAAIRRFGVPVGIARQAIPTGHLTHVHNIASSYINNDEDHYE
ncbi:MAG TPA: UxaA family hydrolase [Terriglobales bacterium]|nr:UxaA family hydrolase [Terriglobales bacterium]